MQETDDPRDRTASNTTEPKDAMPDSNASEPDPGMEQPGDAPNSGEVSPASRLASQLDVARFVEALLLGIVFLIGRYFATCWAYLADANDLPLEIDLRPLKDGARPPRHIRPVTFLLVNVLLVLLLAPAVLSLLAPQVAELDPRWASYLSTVQTAVLQLDVGQLLFLTIPVVLLAGLHACLSALWSDPGLTWSSFERQMAISCYCLGGITLWLGIFGLLAGFFLVGVELNWTVLVVLGLFALFLWLLFSFSYLVLVPWRLVARGFGARGITAQLNASFAAVVTLALAGVMLLLTQNAGPHSERGEAPWPPGSSCTERPSGGAGVAAMAPLGKGRVLLAVADPDQPWRDNRLKVFAPMSDVTAPRDVTPDALEGLRLAAVSTHIAPQAPAANPNEQGNAVDSRIEVVVAAYENDWTNLTFFVFVLDNGELAIQDTLRGPADADVLDDVLALGAGRFYAMNNERIYLYEGAAFNVAYERAFGVTGSLALIDEASTLIETSSTEDKLYVFDRQDDGRLSLRDANIDSPGLGRVALGEDGILRIAAIANPWGELLFQFGWRFWTQTLVLQLDSSSLALESIYRDEGHNVPHADAIAMLGDQLLLASSLQGTVSVCDVGIGSLFTDRDPPAAASPARL